MCIQKFVSENLKARHYLRDPGVDGKIGFNMNLSRDRCVCVCVWTGSDSG